jgi:hypothetical protein
MQLPADRNCSRRIAKSGGLGFVNPKRAFGSVCNLLIINCQLSIVNFLILCLFAASCGKILQSPVERAQAIAAAYGWQPVQFQSGGFRLFGFIKIGGGDKILRVYIEGDGFAWKSPYTVSADPTPRNPMGLRLAVRDQGTNVLYLGRPCQYTGSGDVACDPGYWSVRRYAPEIVSALSSAIDQAKQMVQASSVGLAGFSGGGVIAALLAAQRNDAVWLTTIAANLDHQAWAAHHGVTPLNGSLNPADLAQALQSVPQIHFIGGKDEKVPESVVRSYVSRMTDPGLTEIRIIPEYDHQCCWAEDWQQPF